MRPLGEGPLSTGKGIGYDITWHAHFTIYLRSDVWYLRNLKRKKALERSLGLKLKAMHSMVRRSLLGDYLTKFTGSNTTLQMVAKYKNVVDRATEMVEQDGSVHPDWALAFCFEYPEGSLEELHELKAKVKRVFQLEGRRILHVLPQEEREKLKDGPLADVLEAFNAVDSEDVLRSHLRQWFSDASINAIMTDGSWTTFDWARGSEDRLAVRLRDFWMDKGRRTEVLTEALREKELLMPERCPYCEAFMNGSDDVSLKSLVARVDLSQRLSRAEVDEKSVAWKSAFERTTLCLETLRMSHIAAVKDAFQFTQTGRCTKKRTTTTKNLTS